MSANAPDGTADAPTHPPSHTPAHTPPATGGSSYLARVFADADADPRHAWTTRRRNRLLLVVTQAACVLAALTLLAFGRPMLALVAFLPFFPLMSLVNIGIHGLLDVPASDLDEVMMRLRHEAKARAHTVVTWLLGLVFVGSPFAATWAEGREATGPLGVVPVTVGVMGGLAFVAMMLPTWLVAWRLPDTGADEHPGTDGHQDR